MKDIKSIKAFFPGINLNVYHHSQLKIKVQNKKDGIAALFQEFPFIKVWEHIYLSDFVFCWLLEGLSQLLIFLDKIKFILGSLTRSEYCLKADLNKILRDIIVVYTESSGCPESNFRWTVFECYLSHYPKFMPDYTDLRATAYEVKNTKFILDSIKYQFSKVGKQSDFPGALEAVLLDFLAMGNIEVVERALIAQSKMVHDFNRDRLLDGVLFSGGKPHNK